MPLSLRIRGLWTLCQWINLIKNKKIGYDIFEIVAGYLQYSTNLAAKLMSCQVLPHIMKEFFIPDYQKQIFDNLILIFDECDTNTIHFPVLWFRELVGTIENIEEYITEEIVINLIKLLGAHQHGAIISDDLSCIVLHLSKACPTIVNPI